MCDVDQIDVVGMERAEFDKLNFSFHTKRSPVITGISVCGRKLWALNLYISFCLTHRYLKHLYLLQNSIMTDYGIL